MPSPEPPLGEPTLAPELQRVAFLVGDWTHTELYHRGAQPQSSPGAGRSKASWLLGDHFLYVLYASRGPWGYFEARGLLSWDAAEKAYRMDWFDDRGHTRRLRGVSTRPGELTLTGEIDVEGRGEEGQITIRHREDGKLLLTVEASPTGQPKGTPLLEAILSPLTSPE